MTVKPISKDVLAEQWFSFTQTLFGRMQKAFREQGLSQKHLAERLGKDEGYISRCLSGRQNMTVRTMHDLARAMDCRLDVNLTPLASLPRANRQPTRAADNPYLKKVGSTGSKLHKWLGSPESAAA